MPIHNLNMVKNTNQSHFDGAVTQSSEAKSKESNGLEERTVSLWKFLGLAKHESAMLFVALLFMIAAEALGLYIPILIADAYNDLVDVTLSTDERMANINRVMIFVIIIHFSSVLLAFLQVAIMGVAGQRVVARTRNLLYSSILKQEIGFFDEHKTGELVSRLGSDADLLQDSTSQALPDILVGIVKMVVSVAIMFWISPKLAAVMMGFVATILIACVPIGSYLGRTSKMYQDALGSAQTYATEALGSMRTVQSFTAEHKEEKRYRSKIGDPHQHPFWLGARGETTYHHGVTMALTNSVFFTIIFGVGFGAMFVTLWYGFKLVNEEEITLGELTAFQSYIFHIGGALGQTADSITKLIQALGAAGRIFSLLERTPLISTLQHDSSDPEEAQTIPLTPPTMVGAVDFSSVKFSYPSRPDVTALNNFTLTIPENTTVAIVGSSGSGKSTVVSLLQRFYDVTEGSITIDGNDIRQLDLKWMRSHIASVQQEPHLFGLTVKENIVYGVDHGVTQDEIEAAARDANAHDFIQAWPDGYNTLVGERGVQLSGGQKQRIAISRALLLAPRILLLDEATSALDSESEYLVQEAINRAVVGRTVLIVAHRLSTIQRAEKIVVMDNHAIVDIGTHQTLMDRCPKYQDLIKRQFLVTAM